MTYHKEPIRRYAENDGVYNTYLKYMRENGLIENRKQPLQLVKHRAYTDQIKSDLYLN